MTRNEILKRASEMGLGDLRDLPTTVIVLLIQARENFQPCYCRRYNCTSRGHCCFSDMCYPQPTIHHIEVTK
jgi:hypothetical protein